MTYPAPPDFASSDAFSAWWSYARDTGRNDICSTDARSLILAARAALGMSAVAVWDAAFDSALAARLRSYGAEWNPVATSIENDAAVRPTVGPLPIHAAIYVAYYRPRNLRFDAIQIAAAYVPPTRGVDLGSGVIVPIVCWDPARDPEVGALTDAQIRVAQSMSPGVRLRPGESLPILGGVFNGPNGPSNMALAAMGVVFVLGVGYIVYKQPKARKSK